jgi:hypothetical protein
LLPLFADASGCPEANGLYDTLFGAIGPKETDLWFMAEGGRFPKKISSIFDVFKINLLNVRNDTSPSPWSSSNCLVHFGIK